MDSSKNDKNPNLNKFIIPSEFRRSGTPLSDNSTTVNDAKVEVHFRNLEAKLIEKIGQAQMIFGCVAWLTREPILDALAKVKHGVSIVVQKEDFLRPDMRAGKDWEKKLRAQYSRLSKVPCRYDFNGLVCDLSICSDPTIDPVRCVGNYNFDKKPTMPRMHNKFLVFCTAELEHISLDEHGEYAYENAPEYEPRTEYISFSPYAVWTGSFNFTFNATNSLENAVYIPNAEIAKAYFDEWQQILALSEQLDWTAEWVEPQWRIGT